MKCWTCDEEALVTDVFCPSCREREDERRKQIEAQTKYVRSGKAYQTAMRSLAKAVEGIDQYASR